jgi:hypothetical protein
MKSLGRAGHDLGSDDDRPAPYSALNGKERSDDRNRHRPELQTPLSAELGALCRLFGAELLEVAARDVAREVPGQPFEGPARVFLGIEALDATR